MISPGPADQDARHSAGQGAPDRRGQAGRAAEDGEALHGRGAARHRLGAGRSGRRFHAAAEGGRQAVLPLPADLSDHFPNLPSKRFEGQSRIGQFGDSLDGRRCHRGQDARCVAGLGLEQDTIVIFASDNGPQGEVVREFGGDMPDMGSPGPYRGELGDASEGSIRTAAMIRWPGQIRPGSSYAMFSIMDFFSTLARLAGARCRTIARSTVSTRRISCSGRSDRTARRPADLRRPRARRGALEAVPHVLRRRGAGPQRLGRRTRPAGDGQQRRADERLPQGLQYRVRSARGAQHRRVIRVGNRTDVEGCGGPHGQPKRYPNLPAATQTRW